MNESDLTTFLTETYEHSRAAASEWGDTFFYYNPDPAAPDEIYFASLKSADDEYDNASNLDRPDTFRLNIGIGKDTFFSLFAARPQRPGPEGEFDAAYDFTAADRLLPHPVYGRMYWVAIVNPSRESLAMLRPLLDEAYALAAEKYKRREGGRAAA